jgi:hypothetical protein
VAEESGAFHARLPTLHFLIFLHYPIFVGFMECLNCETAEYFYECNQLTPYGCFPAALCVVFKFSEPDS